jgi:hypothetical protein
MLFYDHIHAYIDAIRMHVPKAKYDYTGRFATTGREQFRKIKIMSQQDAAFIQSFFQDERIECPLKTLILKMDGVMRQRIEEGDRLWRNAHVGKKFHAVFISIGYIDSSASHAA